MHLLTVTALYPNAEQIRNGVFVRERLHKLLEGTPGLKATVIAPVPWFPFKSRRFGRYATFARVPREAQDGDVRVLHPRYLQIPRIGELIAPLAYYVCLKRCLARHSVEPPDLVDSHFAFPDGAAAVLLARALDTRVTITVRGSDVNFIAQERIAGRWIRWALDQCDSVIAVSAALAERVRGMIGDASPVYVVRNGVDQARFTVDVDRAAVRRDLNLQGLVVLSVGNLIPLKGHDLVIRAMAAIPDATLCIVGAGSEYDALASLARELGVADRVRFCGEMSQDELVRYYNAADVTVLASSNEGLPNVVLESLACGTPVAATAVGGVPEIMSDPVMGRLLPTRTADAIATAVRELSFKDTCRARKIRDSVRHFDWAATVSKLQQIFTVNADTPMQGEVN